MSTTLGGVTLPDPTIGTEGHGETMVGEGAFTEMADGTIVYDFGTGRRSWSLAWRGINSLEKNSLYTQYLVKTTQAFQPPDTTSTYTVIVTPNTWRCNSFEVGTSVPYYDASFTLEETS